MNNKVINELNILVSDFSVLYMKLHNLHWHVTGDAFFQLHEVYEKEYTELTEDLDEVAERVLTIGGVPVSTLKEQLELSEIKEIAPTSSNGVKHVYEDYKLLLERFKNLFEVSEEANDIGTNDLATQLISKYEKKLWMLDAFLK